MNRFRHFSDRLCGSPRIAAIVSLLLILIVSTPPTAPAQDNTTAAELAAMRETIAEMQKTIAALNAKIENLEQNQASQAKSVATAEANAEAARQAADTATQSLASGMEGTASRDSIVVNSPSYQFLEQLSVGEISGSTSPVRYRSSFVDRQEAAPRPLDYTLDPEYRGFIPVPNTPALIKLNFKPRIDLITDSTNTGTPYRFVPARFPLQGSPEAGGGARSTMSANGTQLRADVRAPSREGNFRLYYQSDFFGDDDKNMRYRLQHLYGQYFGLTVGFTYSAWENPDIWPDTVDYEGPNAVIFARRPVAQYTHAFDERWNATIGVEQPDYFIDGGDKLNRMPDIAANLRFEDEDIGLVQLSGIARDLGARGPDGRDQHEFGWGVNLGASLNIGERDTLQFLGVYGEGIGGMGNDTSFLNSDGAFTSGGTFEALPYWSLMLGYTHHWSENLRSTVSYGYAHLDPASGQDPTFFQASQYASANLIWQIRERWGVGAEALYGFKEAQNGEDSGDIYRFQIGMFYSIFD